MIKQALLRASVAAVLGTLGVGCTVVPADRSPPAREEAVEAYRAGDHALAVRLFRAHLQARPNDARGWYLLGNAEAQRGRLTAAQTAYYKALARDGGLTAARHNLGLVQLRLGVNALRQAGGVDGEGGVAANTRRYVRCLVATLEAGDGASACVRPDDGTLEQP